MGQGKEIKSHHIFLMPFTIAPSKAGPAMDAVAEYLAKKKDTIWHESRFAPHEGGLAYGEHLYFHNYVSAQYISLENGRGGAGSQDAQGEPRCSLRFFKCALGPEARFEMEVEKKVGGKTQTKTYSLSIQNITLRIFETDVGILSLELINREEHTQLDDVLRINDLGRRIFPPYLGANKKDKEGAEKKVKARTCNDVPLRVTVSFPGFDSQEEFLDAKYKTGKLAVADYLEKLLAEAGLTADPDQLGQAATPFLFRPTVDDRMFLVCWYGSDAWSHRLCASDGCGARRYQSDPDWYRFVFVDGGDLTCQNPAMLRRLIKDTTYDRWLDYGTLYGISRYSLVCLSNEKGFPYDHTREHVRSMYQQMAAMLLAQRASIIQFSNRVNHISASLPRSRQQVASEDLRKLSCQVGSLHRDYICFINRLWYREVTPQEQGIEMYQMAFALAGLEESMADLRNEIKELYEYVGMEHDRAEDDKIRVLTVMGSAFLPIGLVAALFSMDPSLVSDLVQKLWLFIRDGIPGGMQNFRAAYKPGIIFLAKTSGVVAVIVASLALARRLICRLTDRHTEITKHLYLTKLLALLFSRVNGKGKEGLDKG